MFLFNDTATTEIYTLSLHDALPISPRRVAGVPHRGPRRHGGGEAHPARGPGGVQVRPGRHPREERRPLEGVRDRKSTRLNSSHANISYAVFCLKKKKPPSESRLPLT